MKRGRKTVLAAMVFAALGGGSVCRQAAAQPQPIANPPVARFPIVTSAGSVDRAVDIGLWQVFAGDARNLALQKVYVLGTTGANGPAQVTLARYSPSGSLETSVTWPGTTGVSIRSAKAMTIPVVDGSAYAEEKAARIFVAATVDGVAGTTDLAVLAFNFDLKLIWMTTYNYVPDPTPDDWAGDDEPVAITTDQSIDIANESIEYSIVAVLGSSQGSGTGKDLVTLAYHAPDGCQILSPKRWTSAGNHDDYAVDIACGRGAAKGCSNCTPQTAIFTVGAVPDTSSGWNKRYFAIAYLLPGDTCPTSGGNGSIAAGWPRVCDGAFQSGTYDFISSSPVRAKFLKGGLYITGTTQTIGGSGPFRSDMLTVRYSTLETSAPGTNPLVHQMDFTDASSGHSSRLDSARDLELFSPNGSTEIVAVTGSSSGTDPSGTGIATQLYTLTSVPILALTPSWTNGAIWVRDLSPSTVNNDVGLRLQMIDSDFDEAELNSRTNIFATGQSTGTNGFQYVSIKYGTTLANPIFYHKQPSWTLANIPNTFYSNGGVAGDHVPARLVAERKMIPPRRIFITGSSPAPAPAIDWATQFLTEQY